jgi:hypothetical protein
MDATILNQLMMQGALVATAASVIAAPAMLAWQGKDRVVMNSNINNGFELSYEQGSQFHPSYDLRSKRVSGMRS